jgi:phosphatidylinositol-3-phosphatase
MKKIYSIIALTGMLLSTTIGFSQVPIFSHIVIVIGENTTASTVFGSSDAPYINGLAEQGAKFTNSFALSHPSQPNYLQLYSGDNQGITDDNHNPTKFTSANLGSELLTAGKTYTTYSDGLPSVGFDGTTSENYVRKHNPATNWMGTGINQIPTTTNQPFTAFPTNFNNLPSVCLVVPDMCHDGHDSCPPLSNKVLQYDTWVSQNLDAYKQWCINNNSLLIVTYDEDDFTSTNKIATVFYGAHVAVGTYSETINHYNILRTIEDANSLTSHAGSAATATTIDYCWQPLGLTSNIKNEIKIFLILLLVIS